MLADGYKKAEIEIQALTEVRMLKKKEAIIEMFMSLIPI